MHTETLANNSEKPRPPHIIFFSAIACANRIAHCDPRAGLPPEFSLFSAPGIPIKVLCGEASPRKPNSVDKTRAQMLRVISSHLTASTPGRGMPVGRNEVYNRPL